MSLARFFESRLLPITPAEPGQRPHEYLRAALDRWEAEVPGAFTLSLVEPDSYLEEALQYGHPEQETLDALRGAPGDVLAVLEVPRCEVYSARRFLKRLARHSNRLGPQLVAALERAAYHICPVFGPLTAREYLSAWDADMDWRDIRDAVARERGLSSDAVTKAMLREYLDEQGFSEPNRAQHALGRVVYRALERRLSLAQLAELARRAPEPDRTRLLRLLDDIEHLGRLGEELSALGGEETDELFRALCAYFPTPAFVLDVSSAEFMQDRWGSVQEVLEDDYRGRMEQGESPPPTLAIRLDGGESSASRLRRAAELMAEGEALTRELICRIHDWGAA